MTNTEAWQVECPQDCQLLMAAANVPAKATWHMHSGERSLLEWLPAAPQREAELIALFFCPRNNANPWSFPAFMPQHATLTQSWAQSTSLLLPASKPWLVSMCSGWNRKSSPRRGTPRNLRNSWLIYKLRLPRGRLPAAVRSRKSMLLHSAGKFIRIKCHGNYQRDRTQSCGAYLGNGPGTNRQQNQKRPLDI